MIEGKDMNIQGIQRERMDTSNVVDMNLDAMMDDIIENRLSLWTNRDVFYGCMNRTFCSNMNGNVR